MGTTLKDLDQIHVIDSLAKICLGEEACGSCDRSQCVIGYAQDCVTNCIREKVTFVEDGAKKIPHDFKVYSDTELANGIANILNGCRSCGLDHFENCIINVIRNCCEVALFGETQPYEGSALRYLAQLNMQGKKDAELILEEYHKIKDQTKKE